ncbi:Smr/MutS family protein [Pontibacter sp. G13]|uniref:Smr/MutS family protein n=1 Tax=Pontibacter sp. G13 TaxID=3074898 RepID=UPI00288B21F8|nr:Smr/MutS family protein [Pontibacter sp. G13]WNJ17005.1 Smr/MutS family protein [Pontibacter sp. G13]
MKFRVGQRVRYLHASGEGVITALIDNRTIEVDFGDDFPIEVDADELTPIDSTEQRYMGTKEDDADQAPIIQEKKTRNLRVMGTNVLDVSLVVVPLSDDRLELSLVNPEPTDMLATCYGRNKGKYTGLRSGTIDSGEVLPILRCSKQELHQYKSFYFQILSFVPGKGHPHAPFVIELPWNKGRIMDMPKYVAPVGREGWVFSLREDKQVKDVQAIKESEFVRVRKQDAPSKRETPEVDLHIEVLVKKPHELAPSEMLKTQLHKFHEVMSQSVVDHYAGVVFIHGVGTGSLKKSILAEMKKYTHVKSVSSADPKKYGNGATLVEFK